MHKFPPQQIPPGKSRAGSSESGVVLIWTLFVILPLFFVGLVFLSYAEFNISKMRSQFHVNNTVIFGSRSATFDSNDSLNAMAADIYASTISAIPKPDETWQDIGNYSVVLDHAINEGSNTVTAMLWAKLGPVDSFLAQLGSVDVATASQATPDPNFISFVIDYSVSLIRSGSSSDILEAFGVTDSSGGVGPNGVDVGGVVYPNNAMQLALPGSMSGRDRHDWLRVGAGWPYPVTATPGCTATNENWCHGGPIPHKSLLSATQTNLFLAYKKAALILLGVVGQMTPYLDIEILAGPIPPWVKAFIDVNMYGTPPGNEPTPYQPFENDGVHPIWQFDEISASTYSYNFALNPPLRANVSEYHGFSNPKNIFEDDMLMDFSRPMIVNLINTRSRKNLLYNTFSGTDGSLITPDDGYAEILSPPLPNLNNPLWNPPPTDSLPNDTGAMITVPGGAGYLSNELIDFFGLPGYPSPILSLPSGAYTASANVPEPYKSGIFYSCPTTGYAKYNNGPLEQGSPLNNLLQKSGYYRCVAIDWCDDGSLNNSPGCNSDVGALKANYVNTYNTEAGESPGCPAGSKPRCVFATGQIELSHGVWCAMSDESGNPTPRCVPNPYYVFPACVPDADADNPATIIANYVGRTIPTCSANLNGHHTCTAAQINAGTCSPPAGGIAPNDLGTITVPAGPAPLVGANVFFGLMDMHVGTPGTFTHSAINSDRCDEVRAMANDDDFRCLTLIITDGEPKAINFNGSPIMSTAELQTEITNRVNDYVNVKGGKIFVWYLKHRTSLDGIRDAIEDQYATLTANQQNIYDTYLRNDPPQQIPAASCPDFNAIQNVVGCSDVNAFVLQYIDTANMIAWFRNFMDDPPNKVWVDTDLQNTPTGPDISGSLATFLTGMKQVVAAMINEARLSR